MAKRIGGRIFHLGMISCAGSDKKINQDAALVGITQDQRTAYIIVADGLGSCSNSDKGSKRIVHLVKEWIENQLPKYSDLTENVALILERWLITKWEEIYEGESSDYDTTVHYAIFRSDNLMVGGIGDGMLIIGSTDGINDYIPEKDYFTNITDSISSTDAVNKFHSSILHVKNKFTCVIATDGIAEDLDVAGKRKLPGYFEDKIEKDGENALYDELKDWVNDWGTELSSDDRTLVYMIGEE